jgi:hypothetical protein
MPFLVFIALVVMVASSAMLQYFLHFPFPFISSLYRERGNSGQPCCCAAARCDSTEHNARESGESYALLTRCLARNVVEQNSVNIRTLRYGYVLENCICIVLCSTCSREPLRSTGPMFTKGPFCVVRLEIWKFVCVVVQACFRVAKDSTRHYDEEAT